MKKRKLNIIVLFVLLIFSLFSFPTKLSSNLSLKRQSNNDYNFTNLVVFARFNNEDEFINDICWDESLRTLYDNTLNNSSYSLKNYYSSVSNNKLRMENVFLFDDNSSLILNANRGYFALQDDLNSEGFASDSEGKARMYDLKLAWSEAINKALKNQSSLFNAYGEAISDYSILDRNNDGYIDSLTIIYKESPSTLNVPWSSPLWNYQDVSTLVEVKVNNKIITSNKYVQITNSILINKNDKTSVYYPKDDVKIGSPSVLIHEMGHIFGLKDLYRSDMSSAVYYHSAMAKHLSPIPQYISTKEREALGWINNDQIININKAGIYTLSPVSDSISDNKVAAKIKLNNGKTAYLEYRVYDKDINRFDNQKKIISKNNEPDLKGIYIKSGLVCFLVDSDTKFPNNLNTSGNKWNYQVIEIYSADKGNTKNQAALVTNDYLDLSNDVGVYIEEMNDSSISFSIEGNGYIEEVEPIINDIEIIDKKEELSRGESYLFKAKITGENLTGNEKIYWSINGNSSDLTTISEEGLLTIANNENSSSIEVKASFSDEIYKTISIKLNIVHVLIYHEKKESTCIEEGNIKYYYCEECNKYFKDDKHNEEININDIKLSLSNNHHEKVIKGYEATCLKTGLTDKIICKICNKTLVEASVIEKLEHTVSDWIITNVPTYEETGLRHKECTVCHGIIVEEVMDKLLKVKKTDNNYILTIVISITLCFLVLIGGIVVVIVFFKKK